MALQKNLEDVTGITGNYWKVVGVRLYYPTHAIIDVHLYKDATARQADKTEMKIKNYNVSGDAFSNFSSSLDAKTRNPREEAYVYLKTLDDFSGASDV